MRILRRTLVWLMLMSTVLVGCGSSEKLEPVELAPIEPEVELVELWNQRIGGYGDKFLMYAPVVRGDKLFVMNHEGLVVGLSKAEGRTLWRQKLDLELSGGLGADSGRIYLAVFDGRVIALEQENGAKAWEAKVSSEVLAPPQSNGGLVVVQTIDGKVYGFDSGTGQQRWVYSSVQPVLTLRGTATPLVTSEVTYAGMANGDVVALENGSGRAIWERKVGVPSGRTELERLVDIDGGFVLEDRLLYTVGYQGKLVALDTGSGQEVWSKAASSLRKPATGYSNVYMVSGDDDVTALGKLNQASIWRQEGLKRRELSSPAVLDGTLMVGDFEGYVHFLSQVDGRFVARIRPDLEGVRATPVVVDDIAYILGNSGRLSAWKIRQPNPG